MWQFLVAERRLKSSKKSGGFSFLNIYVEEWLFYSNASWGCGRESSIVYWILFFFCVRCGCGLFTSHTRGVLVCSVFRVDRFSFSLVFFFSQPRHCFPPGVSLRYLSALDIEQKCQVLREW